MTTFITTSHAANARDNYGALAADLFIQGCMKNPGNTQLSILNFTRNRDLKKKSLQSGGGLFASSSSTNLFTHINGVVVGFVSKGPLGSANCSVIVKKSKNKQATADAAAQFLAASGLASSRTIESQKKRRITTHTVEMGAYKAFIGVNATGRNVIIQLK
jgi:hypothetical protein